jgi:hypothetical protein
MNCKNVTTQGLRSFFRYSHSNRKEIICILFGQFSLMQLLTKAIIDSLDHVSVPNIVTVFTMRELPHLWGASESRVEFFIHRVSIFDVRPETILQVPYGFEMNVFAIIVDHTDFVVLAGLIWLDSKNSRRTNLDPRYALRDIMLRRPTTIRPS